MSNTIVNIIDREDPLPLYLFFKERYKEGDRLMFVAGKNESDKINFFVNLVFRKSVHFSFNVYVLSPT